VLNHQADIGIALDGDGDRLVIMDEQAHIITADRLISLFAQMCLEQHPQAEIVFDVKCSSMVTQTVNDLGGIATMIRTGSSFLRRYLSQSQGKAVFGGEYAGHYVFNDGRGFGYDDGVYAALRVLEYLSQFLSKHCLSCCLLSQSVIVLKILTLALIVRNPKLCCRILKVVVINLKRNSAK
jgi:phosphomannomutase/phosphoglucomutase